jgi:kynurenine formamidase
LQLLTSATDLPILGVDKTLEFLLDPPEGGAAMATLLLHTRAQRARWILAGITATMIATAGNAFGQEVAAKSPWGPDDEIGRLNMMTDATRLAALSRISSGKVYDLGVDYFLGMPSWQAIGDPRYQLYMTHTPRGVTVDNPFGFPTDEMNKLVSYTGDAMCLYTHTGTHADALNHFGLHGKIWNEFEADEHLGDRGWHKAGMETVPPIIGRGVLIDVAGAKGMKMLPDSYAISAAELRQVLSRQGTRLSKGDIVLIRTGRMTVFESDPEKFKAPHPGITLDAARWLIDDMEAMTLGADNLTLEVIPAAGSDAKSYIPVHTFLFAQRGALILEVVDLEALARDKVYEFVFIGAPLKLRGASGAPLRPVAIPIR